MNLKCIIHNSNLHLKKILRSCLISSKKLKSFTITPDQLRKCHS